MATDIVKKSDSEETYSEIPELGMEVGTDGALAFSTAFNPVAAGVRKNADEELHEILRDSYTEERPTVRQLTTMRRLDGHARALYRLMTLPVRAALNTATFVAADGGEEEAEFIDAVFRTPPTQGGMTTTLQSFMGHLLSGTFDGFSCFEKVFYMPEEGPLAGKYTYKKLAHRPAETVTFVADRNGSFAGLRQQTFVGGRTIDAFIEPEYAFYYAAQEEERKFYGVSFFESAFPHYDAKVKAYFTAHLAAQRAAVGTRVGSVPPNASKASKQEFARNLSNLALAQWMMVPEGFKVELMKESGNFDFLNLINHHNHMMSESILANFFDKDSGGGSGESGSLVNFAQPGDDMFILMLRAVMDDIADNINRYLIPQLVDYNFKGSKYPTFTWGTFTDEQRQAIASTFDKLATAGESINVSRTFMRELEKTMADEMGLSIDWEEVEREEAELEAQQAAMDAGGALPGQPGAPGGNEELAAVAAAGDSITDADLESATDLSDILGLMARRADEAAASGGAPAAAAQEPEDPEEPVRLTGVTEDMIEWANQLVALSGEDWSDG